MGLKFCSGRVAFRMNWQRRTLLALIVMALLLLVAASRPTVRISRAATLSLPFDQLAPLLPGWNLQQESAGSRFLLHELDDLQRPMDVLAVADRQLFVDAWRQAQSSGTASHTPVRWWLCFARNELVLAYLPRSRYASQINASNWMQILLRPGVESGYADPKADPEGYNTLLAWKLAERYYHQPGLYQKLKAAVPAGHLRAHSVALLALLQTGELDYIWEYRSVAEQHHLKFVELPAQINLGDPQRASLYRQVSVKLPGNRPGTTTEVHGAPILYAATIPSTAPNPAGGLAFLQKLVSPDGQAVLRRNFQLPLTPARLEGDTAAAPAALRQHLQGGRR